MTKRCSMSSLNMSIDNSHFILSLVKSIDTHLTMSIGETNNKNKQRVLESLQPIIDDVYNVITLTSRSALEDYCQQYQNFGYAISMILGFADDIASGKVEVSTPSV